MQLFQMNEHYFTQKIRLNSCIPLDIRKASWKTRGVSENLH